MLRYPMKDKVVIVTGGANGLGRCLSIQLAEKGAKLIILDKDEKQLKSIQRNLENKKCYVDSHLIDLADLTSVRKKADALIDKYNKIDILINCAGFEVDGFIDDVPLEAFQENYNVNFYAPLILCKKVMVGMKKRRSGQIVNVCSAMARRSVPGRTAYCITKSALSGLTESLRLELRPYNIDAVTVSPGVMNTYFADRIKKYGRMFHYNDARPKYEPAAVAKRIIKGLERRHSIISKFSMVDLFLVFNGVFPLVADKIINKAFKIEESNV